MHIFRFQGLCIYIYIIIYIYLFITHFEETKNWKIFGLRSLSVSWFEGPMGVQSCPTNVSTRDCAGSWCFQTRPEFLWAMTIFQKMGLEKTLLGRRPSEMKRDITSISVEGSRRMSFVKCETIVMPNWRSQSWLYPLSRWIFVPVGFLNQMPMDMWPCLCQSTSWAIPVHWTHNKSYIM